MIIFQADSGSPNRFVRPFHWPALLVKGEEDVAQMRQFSRASLQVIESHNTNGARPDKIWLQRHRPVSQQEDCLNMQSSGHYLAWSLLLLLFGGLFGGFRRQQSAFCRPCRRLEGKLYWLARESYRRSREEEEEEEAHGMKQQGIRTGTSCTQARNCVI